MGLLPPEAKSGPVVGPDKAAALKVAYLRYIAEYTSWPDSVNGNSNPFTFCLLGRDDEGLAPFIEALIVQKGIQIHNKPPELKQLNPDTLEQVSGSCNVLYVFSSEIEHWSQYQEILNHQPIMTVSASKDFADNGGIIQFVRVPAATTTDGFQYHLHVNLKNCQDRGLRLSSKFLGLRKTVKVVKMPDTE